MDTFKVGGAAIIAVCAAMILKGTKAEWAMLIRIGATITLSAILLPMLLTTVGYVKELGDTGIDKLSLEILLKALCIALLTHVTSSICKDAGESGIAGLVETAGKLEILLLSFPLIKEILLISSELLSLGG